MREHGDRTEHAHGSVTERPVPTGSHSDCQVSFASALKIYGRKTGIGKPRTGWHHRFGPPDDIRIYVPDVVFVFTKDKPALPEYANVASELMIEIYSPPH